MLLGERVRDGAGRDEAEIDEHLPERRAAPVLLGEGVQKLVFRQEALIDHDLAELPPRIGCRVHEPSIGRNLEGLKGQARSPASVQSTKASQCTPITSVWIPSTSTAVSAAPSQGST